MRVNKWFLLVLILTSCQTSPQVELAQDYLVLGNAYYEQKNWAEAIRFLNRSLELNPENNAARYNLALAYLQLSKTEEALTHLEKLKTTQPDNTLVLKALAYAQFWSKKYSEADETYQKIAELLPNDPEILFNRGIVAFELKRDQEAKTLLEQWLEGEKNPPNTIWPILEGLYRRLKDEDGLMRSLIQIVAQNKNDTVRALELAELYKKKGEWQKHLDLLIQVDSSLSLQNKVDNQLRWQIGETFLLQLRQQDPAVEWFSKAIQAGFRNSRRAEILLTRSEVLNPEFLRDFFIEKKILGR